MFPKGTDMPLRQLLFQLLRSEKYQMYSQKQKPDYDVNRGTDLEVWQAVVEENVPAAEK